MSTSSLRVFKADFFKALANPVRIEILDRLRDGEKSVKNLAAPFDIEQAAVSQHLAVLRAKRIVKTRKDGNSVYYSITDPAIFDLLDDAARIFKNQLVDMQEQIDVGP